MAIFFFKSLISWNEVEIYEIILLIENNKPMVIYKICCLKLFLAFLPAENSLVGKIY